MSQPKWELIDQLGDNSPIEYGGYFIFRDKTGVYCEEGELLIVPEAEEEGKGEYLVYRIVLDKCTFLNGVLSENKFHPSHPAWFADDLSKVAGYVGCPLQKMIADLCSDDPLKRAHAYRAIGDYHGFENLDGYPLTLTYGEAKKRYKAKKYNKTPA